MLKRIAMTYLVIAVLAVPAAADGFSFFDRCKAPGTWFVNVSFPDIGLNFQQLLTLHRGGTLTETNNILHANSIADPNAPLPPPPPPPFPPPPPPLNGSDAHGSWQLLPGCHVRWSYLKMVFAGVEMPLPNGVSVPPGTPVGYLRVSTVARISGNQYSTESGNTTTELLFGPDPKSPMAVVPFPDSTGVGYRWLPSD